MKNILPRCGLDAELHDGWEAPVFIGFVAADHKCVAGVWFGWMNDAQRPKPKDVDLGVRRMVMRKVLWAFALLPVTPFVFQFCNKTNKLFFAGSCLAAKRSRAVRPSVSYSKRFRNGRNLTNKNIKQDTFKGHSN